MSELQRFYNRSTGLWDTTGWWNSANALTATVDYSILTGSRAYVRDIAATFGKHKHGRFLNDAYDDEGWWALAWIRSYDLTRERRYLDAAKSIFADMTRGWDATCGGGIWWTKRRTYKNAIANELFLAVAAKLHARTPGDAGPRSYLDWAMREWSWFDRSGLINARNLVNDGLRRCANNGGSTWTYNQGVLIGGLVELARATGDATLLARAGAIADAAMTTLVDARGILRDRCEPTCNGNRTQFKGVFMRNLAELAAATGDARQRAFILTNADAVWTRARNARSQFGLVWDGPFDAADASRQASALDALNAAVASARR